MKNFIAQWLKLWGGIINLEVLVYGKEEKEKMRKALYKCLNITDPNEFEKIRAETLNVCITSQERDKKQEMRMSKRSSFLSFLVGDGQEIDKTQADLNQITDTFNKNFHLIHNDEEMMRVKLNQLIKNENILSRQETVLYHKLQILEIDNRQQARKWSYEQRRTQQIESLLNMIQNSILRQTIRHLHIGLQKDQNHQRECQINRCISHMTER